MMIVLKEKKKLEESSIEREDLHEVSTMARTRKLWI
jgi:hypothetical protein